ncbi:WhiB family transcriptional regulator [Fodinibacter luteus]|uniref:WhiB family transcriptional regulator n=1 Tax=Fodinibacter luteus TaxID=552064 RepID=UPI0031EBEE0F
MTAGEALARAVAALAETGRRPVCVTDPDAWTSERRADLEQAAPRCQGCPLLDPCGDAGEAEDFGVWGGRIRDRRFRTEDRAAS